VRRPIFRDCLKEGKGGGAHRGRRQSRRWCRSKRPNVRTINSVAAGIEISAITGCAPFLGRRQILDAFKPGTARAATVFQVAIGK